MSLPSRKLLALALFLGVVLLLSACAQQSPIAYDCDGTFDKRTCLDAKP